MRQGGRAYALQARALGFWGVDGGRHRQAIMRRGAPLAPQLVLYQPTVTCASLAAADNGDGDELAVEPSFSFEDPPESMPTYATRRCHPGLPSERLRWVREASNVGGGVERRVEERQRRL